MKSQLLRSNIKILLSKIGKFLTTVSFCENFFFACYSSASPISKNDSLKYALCDKFSCANIFSDYFCLRIYMNIFAKVTLWKLMTKVKLKLFFWMQEFTKILFTCDNNKSPKISDSSIFLNSILFYSKHSRTLSFKYWLFFKAFCIDMSLFSGFSLMFYKKT